MAAVQGDASDPRFHRNAGTFCAVQLRVTAMAIPEEWIKRYVDLLLEAASKLPEGNFKAAVLTRADNAMDLVKAWRQSQKEQP